MRCIICGVRGHVIDLDGDSTRVVSGLVRVRDSHLCPECVREAVARYARVVKHICAAEPMLGAEEREAP